MFLQDIFGPKRTIGAHHGIEWYFVKNCVQRRIVKINGAKENGVNKNKDCY